jgi:hypothetical protein
MSAPCATVPAAASPLLATRRSVRASASVPMAARQRSTGCSGRVAALAVPGGRLFVSHNQRSRSTARAALPVFAAASTVRRTP